MEYQTGIISIYDTTNSNRNNNEKHQENFSKSRGSPAPHHDIPQKYI
jgi:hypothetical protein